MRDANDKDKDKEKIKIKIKIWSFLLMMPCPWIGHASPYINELLFVEINS